MSTLTFVLLNILIIVKANEFSLANVEMRLPRQHDIGLYFDLQFSNIKEIVNFNIQTKKCCLCLANEVECDSFKLIGGQSEDLYPNTKSITFTLVLPTLLLHNRVGFCDVVINAIKRDGETINKFHKIHFNTSLTNSCMKKYVIGMNLTSCLTSDLSPLKKCFPENCYEKYFGKRNFFNETRKLCEVVPDCGAKRDFIYDSVNNQCIDFDDILTDEDLIKIKSGEYDKNSPPPEIIDQNIKVPEVLNTDIAPYTFESSSFLHNWINTVLMITTSVLLYSLPALVISYFFFLRQPNSNNHKELYYN